MGLEAILILALFFLLLSFLLLGIPVAFALSGAAIIIGALGHVLEVFYWSDFTFLPMRIFGVMQKVTLIAVPLFIFMGVMLEKSGIAKELLETVSSLFRKRKASLAIGVVLVGAIMAASTGIVGATVVTMGVLSLPTMLKHRYDPSLSAGTIAAAGTLGQIIPPSIVLVLLGDMMNVDVGQLFMGALIPGLLLVATYIGYIWLRVTLQPHLAPPYQLTQEHKLPAQKIVAAFIPPLLLMIVVLGSILTGLASPTEAAGCGALGALILAAWKKRLHLKVLDEVMSDTAKITSMVFLILVGAQFFGIVFRGLSGDELISDFLEHWGLQKHTVLFILMALLFVLGFFLDFIEICFIVVPIIMPLLNAYGFDPVWVAVLIAINLQTSFLTPPFGFALFYLKGVAPPGINATVIYRGALPFVAIQITVLMLIYLFPALVSWPVAIFNG